MYYKTLANTVIYYMTANENWRHIQCYYIML